MQGRKPKLIEERPEFAGAYAALMAMASADKPGEHLAALMQEAAKAAGVSKQDASIILGRWL